MLTGKVGEVEDVISVVLPSNIKMTIKTDEEGRLDEAGTRDVSVAVENESRSTKAVRLALYETTDDQRLLDEVVLSSTARTSSRPWAALPVRCSSPDPSGPGGRYAHDVRLAHRSRADHQCGHKKRPHRHQGDSFVKRV